jgi:hypothetical protein
MEANQNRNGERDLEKSHLNKSLGKFERVSRRPTSDFSAARPLVGVNYGNAMKYPATVR